MFVVGMVIVFFLGVWVIENYGWCWMYYLVVFFVVLMFFFVWKIFRESCYVNFGKVDWVGVVFFIFFVVLMFVVVIRVLNVGWIVKEILIFFGVGVIGVVFFVFWERRVENLLLLFKIIFLRNFVIVNLGIMLVVFGFLMMS